MRYDGTLTDRDLRRMAPLDYSKYQVRRLPQSGTQFLPCTWHVWCPVCVMWMCCKSGAKYTADGYTNWAQATASLATHRKIWHT